MDAGSNERCCEENRYGKNGYGKRKGKDRTSGLNQAGRREEEKNR